MDSVSSEHALLSMYYTIAWHGINMPSWAGTKDMSDLCFDKPLHKREGTIESFK